MTRDSSRPTTTDAAPATPTPTPTRRGFLRIAGATAGAATGGSVLAGPAVADHFDEGTDVTRTFDEPLLDAVRPLFDLRATEGTPDLVGFAARTDGEDLTACVFWLEWMVQDGLTTADSHLGDHEPIYVFVDEAGGPTVEEVVYSGYHWLAASTPAPPTDADGHPQFRVVNTYHHYALAPDLSRDVASLLDVQHLDDDLFRDWLDEGLEDDLEPGAVRDPWVMRQRESWWRNNSLGFSATAWLQRVKLLTGQDNARATDLW